MTNRRSLQTNMQRISRAQQFVPGHVGGRVASAQPVRQRTRVGAVVAPLGTPPLTIDSYQNLEGETSPAAAMTMALAAPPVGGTIVAVIAGRSAHGTFPTLTAPTGGGWRSLADGTEDSGDGAMSWSVAVLEDYQAGDDMTWTWGAIGSNSGTVNQFWFCYHFTGAVGGTWECIVGASNSGGYVGPMTAPDPAWQVWQQINIYGGGYSNWITKPADATGQINVLAAMNNTGGTGGPQPENLTPTPWTGTYQHGTIGAYGSPTARSLAIGWRP